MAKLVLVRHGESEWNAKGLWAGWTDVSLTENGRKQAQETGRLLTGIQFDTAFTSPLIRAKDTLQEILTVLNQTTITVIESDAIKERNYGDLTGKDKWQVKKEVGDEVFLQIRRSWDYPIPNGESLKQVYERVLPYYTNSILPLLQSGKNVIVAAHGNSLRALVKHLDNISDENIPHFELPIGGAIVYDIDANGSVINREMKGGELDHPRS